MAHPLPRPSKLAALVSAGLLLSSTPTAQVSRGGEPLSRLLNLEAPSSSFALPSIDIESLMLEDELSGKGQATRFGETVPVELSLESAGAWENVGGGARVWRLQVRSTGALSIGLLFDRFLLAEGAEFFVLGDDGTMTLGAFTAENNRPGAEFATQPVLGESITLELFEPAGSARGSELSISHVVHAYRDIYGVGAGGGLAGSGSCNINVNCTLGATWQAEKRSVAKVLFGGFFCSGALINNTSENERQFFLTANHCLGGSLGSTVFIFNNESATCFGGSGPSTDSVAGATLRASSSASDFGLLEITPQIPESYEVYYAGWDRSGATPTEGTGIHHPSGDIKKICYDDDPLSEVFNGQYLWHVSNWEQGVTEGGSSGSPLFDQNHRIVGQLCCGAASCGFLFNDYYGQFDRNWGFGASAWLDPLGTGQLTLDGLDTGDGIPPAAPVISSIVPASVPSVAATAGQGVTITGTDLDLVTGVKVNGTALGGLGAPWTTVNATTITFAMPLQNALGSVDVTVTSALGSGSSTISVVPASPPAQRLGTGTDNEQLFSFLPTKLLTGGQPGNFVYLLASPSNAPSFVPGLFDLAIGDNASLLFVLGAEVIGAQGWVETNYFFSSLPFGTPVHFQALEYDPVSATFPLEATNASTGSWVF